MAASRPRMTAGVLLSRGLPGALELAVVHRPRYDDWTWPKGGVEPGEQLVEAAAREAREETGFAVTLGHRLGKTDYSRPGGSTEVHWWSATVRPGHPQGEPDAAEVDRVRWVSAAEAQTLLSYPADQIPLAALGKQGPADTTVILVRHANAGDRKLWAGPDAERPLDRRGQDRARRLASVLPVFAPSRLITATPTRCRETVDPLAATMGITLVSDQRFDDSAWQREDQPAAQALAELLQDPGTSVVCSQGETIPGLVTEFAQRCATRAARAAVRRASRGSGPSRTPRSKKGSYWVLSFNEGELVAADYSTD